VSIRKLRESLGAAVGAIDVELPQALPEVPALEAIGHLPARAPTRVARLSLATLLSQTLLAFALEFDREAPAPLAMSANALRVLDVEGVPAGELPRLTGGSPEVTAVGWRLQQSGYVVVEHDPTAGRGKQVRLTPRGLEVQLAYHRLARVIEIRWSARFGKDAMLDLRVSLGTSFPARRGRTHPVEGVDSAAGRRPRGTADAGPRSPQRGTRRASAHARPRGADGSVRPRPGGRASSLSPVGYESRVRPLAGRRAARFVIPGTRVARLLQSRPRPAFQPAPMQSCKLLYFN